MHSAAESELIAAITAVHEGLWLLQLGEIMGTRRPIHVHIDNKAVIDIANSKGLTRHIKHIKIHDAYIQEQGIVEVIQGVFAGWLIEGIRTALTCFIFCPTVSAMAQFFSAEGLPCLPGRIFFTLTVL